MYRAYVLKFELNFVRIILRQRTCRQQYECDPNRVSQKQVNQLQNNRRKHQKRNRARSELNQYDQ